MGLNVLVCVPEICINMLKYVFLKDSWNIPKIAEFYWQEKWGSHSKSTGGVTCMYPVFVKYESYPRAGAKCAKTAVNIYKYVDMSVSTQHLMTSHCGPRYARMCAWNSYKYA